MLDYSGAPSRVILNLGLDTAGGAAAGDDISGEADVLGSAFDDEIVGSVENNSLQGGDGADYLNGAAGDDEIYEALAMTSSSAA